MARTAVHPSRLLRRTPLRLVGSAARWHVTSQQQARRNALVASTALAARRRERVEVEEFLAAHASRTSEIVVPVRMTS